jgi:hypothetical protein
MPVSKEEDARREAAGHYLLDARQHIRAARRCSDDGLFWDTKSGRGKLASFLVVACECLLKGAAARFDESGGNVADIVWSLKALNHNLANLLIRVESTAIHASAKEAFRELVSLFPEGVRVDLRYTIEAWAFYEDVEDDQPNAYYQTIGNDSWHNEVERRIGELLGHPDLHCEGEIVTASDIDLDDLFTPRVKWTVQLDEAKSRAKARNAKRG